MTSHLFATDLLDHFDLIFFLRLQNLFNVDIFDVSASVGSVGVDVDDDGDGVADDVPRTARAVLRITLP